jgi:1-acyl-sn-glycerol-3-phosphate acyltransferase
MTHVFGSSLTRPPLPAYYPLYARRFRTISRMLARLPFSRVDLHLELRRAESLDGAKVVVYANHPGFWDPIMLALLTGRLWPEHAVISPIDAAALRVHRYFDGLGFFALNPGSAAGLRTFLKVAQACLEGDGDHCLALTPEGCFSPPEGPLKLRRGLALALARHQGAPVIVVPVAIGYRMGKDPRPRAALTLGDPLFLPAGPKPALGDLHRELTARLEAAIELLRPSLLDGRLGLNLLEGRSTVLDRSVQVRAGTQRPDSGPVQGLPAALAKSDRMVVR